MTSIGEAFQIFKSKSVFRLVGLATVSAAAVSVAVALENAPSQPNQSGLHGILGKEVPDDLGPDLVSGLSKNWEAWGKGLEDLVTKLYTDEKLDLAGQRDLLRQLESKIQTIDRSLSDPRYAALDGALSTIRGRLNRRLDIAHAILKTLELKPEAIREARLKSARAEVLDALASLQTDLEAVPGGSAWLHYVRADELRKSLSGGQSDGVAAAVEHKLDPAHAPSNPAQKEFVSRQGFRKLSQALTRLEKIEHPAQPYNVETLRTDCAGLVAAIEGYEKDGTDADAKKVRDALVAADNAAADGGDLLARAVGRHYLNFNLQVVASKELLTKLLGDQQTTNGTVSDFIAGASVSGSETTTTNVTVDLEPGNNDATIDLVLNGVTQSSTVGSTSQASVSSSGYHRWGAVKPIHFDGTSISTSPARVTYIQPSTTTTGASTSMSGMPIIGGIANRTAMREAEARRGEADAYATQRIQSRLLPELDGRVDEMIRDTNNRFQNNLKKRLEKAGVMPADVEVRSNQSYLRLSALIMNPGELAGDAVSSAADTSAGLVLHLHETLLNNAVKNIKLAGRTMTDSQIGAEIEKYLTLLTGHPVKFGDAKQKAAAGADNSMLVFDAADPIRFTVENGEVNLVIRAGFKQEGKEDIPVQIVTVPLKFAVNGERVVIEHGTVQVAAGSAGGDRTTQVVRAGVMRKKLETVMQPMVVPAVIQIPRPGRADVNLIVGDIRAQNGWLSIFAN